MGLEADACTARCPGVPKISDKVGSYHVRFFQYPLLIVLLRGGKGKVGLNCVKYFINLVEASPPWQIVD